MTSSFHSDPSTGTRFSGRSVQSDSAREVEWPLVVVMGPTGSGKSSLALFLAEHFNGEIVNCDSVSIYRELEIGTAKPSRDDRDRLPHHLIDVISPNANFSAGDYSRLARRTLAEIRQRGKLPIVTGGTGLYLRALLSGLSVAPGRLPDLRGRLRRIARNKGSAYLRRILRRLDGEMSRKIHVNDLPKIIRAIEVCLASSETMSELWQRGREPLMGFKILRLGLDPPREALYPRINQRAQRMFDSGLAEETRELLRKYYPEDLTPRETSAALNSLGYRQAGKLLRGEVDRPQAVIEVQQAHRNYAKRQMTWFRREPGVHWLKGFGDDEEIQSQAGSLVAGEFQIEA